MTTVVDDLDSDSLFVVCIFWSSALISTDFFLSSYWLVYERKVTMVSILIAPFH